MLHHASVVIDPEELIDINGYTMLLSLCGANPALNVDKFESLRLLLKFGVNVNATDKYGNTAVHLLLKSLGDYGEDCYIINKRFLKLLLQSIMRTGADLHVRNNFGIEASLVAYGNLLHDEDGYNRLHLRTRLWNEVLKDLDLDIVEFRPCCSRSPGQNAHVSEREAICDSFQKDVYLDFKLRPMPTVNFFP